MYLPLISRISFFIALTAVTMLALLPQQQVPVTTGWDKANHVLAFFVLIALLDQSYPEKNLWIKKMLPLFAYGVLIECAQAFTPGRFASGLDVFADTVGLSLYLLIRPALLAHLPFINGDVFRQ